MPTVPLDGGELPDRLRWERELKRVLHRACGFSEAVHAELRGDARPIELFPGLGVDGRRAVAGRQSDQPRRAGDAAQPARRPARRLARQPQSGRARAGGVHDRPGLLADRRAARRRGGWPGCWPASCRGAASGGAPGGELRRRQGRRRGAARAPARRRRACAGSAAQSAAVPSRQERGVCAAATSRVGVVGALHPGRRVRARARRRVLGVRA